MSPLLVLGLILVGACDDDPAGGGSTGADTDLPDTSPDAGDEDTSGGDIDDDTSEPDTTPDVAEPDVAPDVTLDPVDPPDEGDGEEPDADAGPDAEPDTGDATDTTEPDTEPDTDADTACEPGETLTTTCENEGEVVRCTCEEGSFVCDEDPCREDTSCDTGPLTCEDPRPTCDVEGEIPAIRDGCWLCVPADTCGEDPPTPCETDAGCDADEVCGSEGACEASPCTPIGDLVCAAERPSCPGGQVSTVRGGCWACVFEDSCDPAPEPPSACLDRGGACVPNLGAACAGGDTRSDATCLSGVCCVPFATLQCDDALVVTCGDDWPECTAPQIPVIASGCWECRDPSTCGF